PGALPTTLPDVSPGRGRGRALGPTARSRVPPAGWSRESIMDSGRWTYRVMAKELEREGKTAPGHGQKREQVVDDPRRYVYLEARLRLEGAAVAARVGLADGSARNSHEGDPHLAIARDGWVRTAVSLGAAGAPIAFVARAC